MQTVEIENIVRHYQEICRSIPLHTIHNEAEYDHAVQILNELLDAGGANENHPLAMLVTLLGHFIGDYERIYYPADELMR
jgi:HTH-type transcriptional regulator/antitoxin HigA